MATSKNLETAVKKEAAKAEDRASEGNVTTTEKPPQASKLPEQPADLPTGARSHPAA